MVDEEEICDTALQDDTGIRTMVRGDYRQTLHLFCGLFNTYTIDAKLNEHESKQPTYYPNANLNLEQAQRRIPQ